LKKVDLPKSGQKWTTFYDKKLGLSK
jgi:hypothetical protein